MNSLLRVVITFEERQQQDHHFEMWSKHLADKQSAHTDIFYLHKMLLRVIKIKVCE